MTNTVSEKFSEFQLDSYVQHEKGISLIFFFFLCLPLTTI